MVIKKTNYQTKIPKKKNYLPKVGNLLLVDTTKNQYDWRFKKKTNLFYNHLSLHVFFK